MARPKKKDAEKLDKPVSFRLSMSDYEAYQKKVIESGLKPSEFFRTAVITNRTHVIAREKVSQDKTRLLYLFNKTSNNINQLAHRANSDYLTGVIGEETYDQILSRLDTIANVLKATLENAD